MYVGAEEIRFKFTVLNDKERSTNYETRVTTVSVYCRNKTTKIYNVYIVHRPGSLMYFYQINLRWSFAVCTFHKSHINRNILAHAETTFVRIYARVIS